RVALRSGYRKDPPSAGANDRRAAPCAGAPYPNIDTTSSFLPVNNLRRADRPSRFAQTTVDTAAIRCPDQLGDSRPGFVKYAANWSPPDCRADAPPRTHLIPAAHKDDKPASKLPIAEADGAPSL